MSSDNPMNQAQLLQAQLLGSMRSVALLAESHSISVPFIEPTGRKVEALEFAVYRIADDRIGEMWSSLDTGRRSANYPELSCSELDLTDTVRSD